MPDTRPPLSPTQIAYLAYIGAFCDSHGGLGPIIQEVADHFGKTPAGAHDHIQRLTAKGLLVRSGRTPRSLHVTEAGRSVVGAKMAGNLK
jgi:DNA-binding MarR family transcriptional regulator